MTQPKDLRRTLELVRRDKWAHLDIPWFLEELLNRIEALEAQTPSESTSTEPCSHIGDGGSVKTTQVSEYGADVTCSTCKRSFRLPWLAPPKMRAWVERTA